MISSSSTMILGVAAALLSLYLGLFFVARRPVALRLQRVGLVLSFATFVRLILWCGGHPLQSWVELALLSTVAIVAVSLLAMRRVWLVRDHLPPFRQQLESTARGMFLSCEETSTGRFALAAKDTKAHISVVELTNRVLLVVVPSVAKRTKPYLLVRWLAKQYEGPIPRLHFVLSRSKG